MVELSLYVKVYGIFNKQGYRYHYFHSKNTVLHQSLILSRELDLVLGIQGNIYISPQHFVLFISICLRTNVEINLLKSSYTVCFSSGSQG